jgi:uncharacterized protein with PQ loop repeat
VIEAVGYIGSVGAAVMWMPQVRRVVRLRHRAAALRGMSVAGYLVAIVFNALLLAYGFLNQAVPVAVAGVVNLGCAAVIVVLLMRARRQAQ